MCRCDMTDLMKYAQQLLASEAAHSATLGLQEKSLQTAFLITQSSIASSSLWHTAVCRLLQFSWLLPAWSSSILWPFPGTDASVVDFDNSPR